jgi:hypothetical protein
LLDEENAVERMDGWMDGKSTRKNAEDDNFSLYNEKGCEIELTTKREEEPVQGAAN